MGMGFDVIYAPHPPIWVPVDTTDVRYAGQIVYYGHKTPANTGGVKAMVVSAGFSDVTNFHVPFGVVVGDNNRAPVYSTLATALVKVRAITGVDTAAAQIARDWVGAEGMYSKGDPQPLVQVVRITPDTVIRGYFRNSATVGTTVITTLKPSAVATTAMTFATFGFTGVADNSTTYCVSGTNAGLYRVGTDASATACTYTREWPYTPTTNDTFKRVNVRQGICRMDLDTTYGLWIDNTAALSTNNYVVNVLKIDLSGGAGEEYCDFSFVADHFLTTNSARLTT